MTISDSELGKYYVEYLETFESNFHKQHARRSLELEASFKSKQFVKDVILDLMHQKGYFLYKVSDDKDSSKHRYYIGTRTQNVLNLNKTTFKFAEFLINNGYCHKSNKIIDFSNG